ncbi:MAG: hypothetical protein L0323_16010, partial [Planctomycetes bacterium]|nr:hypothetical protein [Planctomycetota bacterium]
PMPFSHLHARLPDLAERETRSVRTFPGNSWGLPPKTFFLHEMYCNEEGCDCRRVFFCVVSSPGRRLEAVIAYGWETPAFYARWLRDADPEDVAEMKGPALNLGSPQTSLAPGLVRMVSDTLLRDGAYVARLKRHYAAFKATILPAARRPAGSGDRRLLRPRGESSPSRPPRRRVPGNPSAADRDGGKPRE